MLNQTPSSYNVDIFWNTTAVFIPYLAVNIFTNNIFKQNSNKENPYIKMSLNPML